MSDVITPNKGLTEPTVGGDSNNWGAILNTDLGLIDSALGGTASVAISGNTTLTSTQAQNTGYEFTGTLTANATITWPAGFNGIAAIRNDTTGGFSISCGISGGFFSTIFASEHVAVWSDGTNFQRLAQIGGNLPRSATQTSTYTIQASDQWKTLSFAGNNCYTVSVPAASGFVGNFEVRLYNADTGRAKWLEIDGYSNFFLWPNQSVVVQNVGGTWQLFPKQQRWTNPGRTFFVDPSGSDAGGANDGLTQGSAFATITNAWTIIRDQTDSPGASIQLTPGATYNISAQIELTGDQASAFGRLLQIAGDQTMANMPIISTSSSISAMIQIRDGLWAQITGVSFVSTAEFNVGVQMDQAGLCDFTNCAWNLTEGICIQSTNLSLSNIFGTHNITTTGTALSFIGAQNGSSIVLNGVTVNGNGGSLLLTDGFVNADLNSQIQISSTTFTGTGSFTGNKYQLTHGSFLSQGGVTLPGNVAGTADATSAAY